MKLATFDWLLRISYFVFLRKQAWFEDWLASSPVTATTAAMRS